MFSDTSLELFVEPIALTIGFKHIDFANIVGVQLQKTLTYINKLKTETRLEPMKESIQAQAEVEKKPTLTFSTYNP